MFFQIFPLFSFLSYLLFIGPASAQIHATTCSDKNDGYDWTYNSLKQNSCLIAAYLSGVCRHGTFTLPALGTQNAYTIAGNSNQCMCNTVVYNLFSACGGCQGGSWNPYSAWSSNCITNATAGTFPEPVPDGTRVPQWAYIDTSGGTWNVSAAQAEGGFPEVTATSSIVPMSTSWVLQSNIMPGRPGAVGGSSSTSTSKSSSKAGAIVGCIVGWALITGVVAWFVVRRRRACSPPSDTSGQGGKVGRPVPYPLSIEPPILYDPSNPTTYPRQEQFSKRNLRFEPTRHLPRNYSGLPEIG